MNKSENLALEIAILHPITEEDAQNLLDGIDSGKAGGTEANYIRALEARDKTIEHLLKERKQLLLTLRDFAKHGTRHDTNPTIGGRIRSADDWAGWVSYIQSMDNYVRNKAAKKVEAILIGDEKE